MEEAPNARTREEWEQFLRSTPALLIAMHLLVALVAADVAWRGAVLPSVLTYFALGLMAIRICVVEADALSRKTSRTMDHALFFVWPIAAPVCMWQLRGSDGLIGTLLCAGSLLMAAGCGAAGLVALRMMFA